MKKSAMFTALLTLCLLTLGCNREESPAPEQLEQPPTQSSDQPESKSEPSWDEDVVPFDPAGFTQVQMLEDYDYLWSILEENCALLDGLEREKELNLDEIRQKGRKKIEALQDGDVEGFEAGISYLGGYFRGVGHLSPVSALTYSTVMERGAYESGTQKEVYHAPQVKAYYPWATAQPKFVSQKKSQEEKIPTSADSAESSGAIEISSQNGTPILRIKTFQFGKNDQKIVIDQLQNFCLDNLDQQNLIIDIRGNGGGYTEVWEQGFQPLFAGKVIEERLVAAWKDTSLNREMWDGWPENEPDVSVYPIEQLGELFSDPSGLKMEDLEQAEMAGQRVTRFDYTDLKNPNGGVFSGHIWLLIDRSNYSAAEALIQRLKNCDFVTMVGNQTKGGGMIFAAPAKIPFILPNSGMLYQYVPFYCMNEDGSCNEFYGSLPDIDVGSEDALEVCLREIERLGDK